MSARRRAVLCFELSIAGTPNARVVMAPFRYLRTVRGRSYLWGGLAGQRRAANDFAAGHIAPGAVVN